MHVLYYFGTIPVTERIGLYAASVLGVYDEILSTDNLP